MASLSTSNTPSSSSSNTETTSNTQQQQEENELENPPILHHLLTTTTTTIPDPSQYLVPDSSANNNMETSSSSITTTSTTTIREKRRIDSPHHPHSSTLKHQSLAPGRGGGCTTTTSRTISPPSHPSFMDVPHFQLAEDPSFSTDHNVQVLIRIRPLNTREKATQGNFRCLRQDTSHSLTWLGNPQTRFTFDHVACETISQEKLFTIAGLPMVENCMSGYNSCMFAYGQTGSGKTYTMMGEIHEMDGKLNRHCGITPRIFEYLFTRIHAEEENSTDENLKYSCRCSFLEIYNEQITDLLEPSSTNLQIREDMRKGVYVENLTEHEVTTVTDVVKLLLQGSANKRMAATHMNSESSRSHSVFTCVIESRRDIDSTKHLRFGRLNLVDLAGSERQKSSGAEGERLKEAANINKSLSTLGLVIMSLVDVAHGKHRHIPYRDSRLTFLLQDSLGGNSKTTIIANISPSNCSANETLSTLKFAQRAKLIQNNAKVNEDASGDVLGLQRQIQQLKDQLTYVLKHQTPSRPLSLCLPNLEQSQFQETFYPLKESISDHQSSACTNKNKIKCTEMTLAGALRRERMAETAVRRVEAEMEHMNRLVHQREEDAQRNKMILRFREEKIKRLDLLADGLVTADEFLMEENSALYEEIHLLQARIDRNPEVTRFALENIRLLEQLRMYEDFYERGERETLLTEISDLRDQLAEILEECCQPVEFSSKAEDQDMDTRNELENCRRNLNECLEINEKLTREVTKLQIELDKYLNPGEAAFDSIGDCVSGNAVKPTDKHLSVVRADTYNETAFYTKEEDKDLKIQNDQNMDNTLAVQLSETEKELMEARFLVEAMESEQVRLIEELNILQKDNLEYLEVIGNEDFGQIKSMLQHQNRHEPFDKYRVTEVLGELDEFLMTEDTFTGSGLQSRLDRMNKDLEEARGLIRQYQDDRASQLFQQKEVEQVCQQVEVETAQTILHLQDSLTTLQQELQERLCLLAEENKRLRYTIASRESEMKGLAEEWEKATLELTTFIADGCRSLEDASNQIEIIVSSFPERENWISEHVGRAAKMFVEKEKTILKLRKSLEDAQKMGSEMEFKLNSLKGATLAITDAELLKNDEKDRETLQLHEQLSKKICKIQELESMIKTMEDQIVDAEKRAYAAFVVVKRLSSFCNGAEAKGGEKEIPDLKLAISFQEEKFRISDIKAEQIAMALEAIDVQVEVARQTIVESEKAIYASYADTETHLSAILSDIAATFSAFPKLFQDLSKDISAIKEQFVDLKEHTRDIKLKDQLDETNRRLHVLKSSIDALQDMHDSENRSLSCDDSLSSLSDISTSSTGLSGEVNGQESYTRESPFTLDGQELGNMKNPKKNFSCTDEAVWYLRNEVELAFTSFLEVRIQLAKLFDRNQLAHEQRISSYESLIYGNDSELNMDHVEGFNQPALLKTGKQVQSYDSRMEEGEERRHDTREMLCLKLQSAMLIADKKINAANNFIVKFEEAQATMKEADVMLNTLLKANENAKHMTDRWKQAGEELKIEKASLIEEVQRLTTTICLQQEEYGSLEDQFHSSLEEIKNLVSSLEISVHETQRDVEERFKLMYADISSLGQDLLDCICTSRSSLEDISSEIMEKGFALFVMYQCQIRGFSEKILGVSSSPLFLHPGEKGFLPILNNVEERGFREDTSALESAISTEEATPSDKMDYRVSNPRDILFPGYSLGKDSEHKEEELGVTQDKLVTENNSLKKDLARKDIILKGLLFDLSLLQESTSNSKDIKDETEQMVVALTQIQDELALKTTQLDVIVVQYKELKSQLDTSEAALSMANSKYEQAQDMCDVLSNQNSDLRNLVNDLFAKKDDIEEQLEDKIEVVKSLEEEILRMALSAEEKILSSVVNIEDELRGVTSERDHLREKVISLKDKLEMANALAEENEAVAVEARQESEASKMYAEQKEEEARILERSVEELEYTINVLEKKVFEMGEEVERHQFKREDLRLATRDPVQRTLAIGDSRQMIDPENFNVEQQTGEQIPGHLDGQMLELHESKNRIRVLEKENAEQAKEIKECRDYISELKLHTDAQSSLYQQKYNMLEAMVRQVKADQSTSTSMALEKTSRSRGSSSPFRCIQGLVQQMNVERDQDLSAARIRIEELEALASRQQKEVCMLHARLAAAESMTHDVIRDLLAVKLDITNYANLVDQGEVQKLVEVAQQQTEEFIAKEHEILKLRKQVNDLMEERQCYLEEKDQRESEILAAQLKVEQLRERDHMLTAQNEMLKMDKANLRRKVTEMDDMVKKQSAKQNILQRTTKMKENSVPGIVNEELSKRLMYSEKLLSNVNNELAWYQKSNGRDVYNRNNDERLRNQRQGKEEDFN